MKKFDLDKAKKGAEVVTKKGKSVKILHYERDSKKFPLVVIIENKKVENYTLEGKFYDDKDSDKDLYLK